LRLTLLIFSSSASYKEIEMNKLQDLAKTYCISGELHEFSLENNICKKCNKKLDHIYSKNDFP